ncbi:MAG: Gfo/Idh/MocA family oxidoreductase [Candidatus Latescibacterota bacterium]
MSDSSRRSFLGKAAVAAGAAAAASGGVKPAEAQAQSARKIKVGIFGAGEYTFWTLWADFLSDKGSAGTALLNMEISHIWDVDPKKAQDFASKFGGTVVKRYDEMVGKVDGVACGGLYEVPWQHRLFRPYLEAGMPVYLSRPWSNRLRDLDEMLELAAKHNAAIIATAAYEHYDDANCLQARLKNVGTIKNVTATCGGGDFPHFHIQHMMTKVLGYNVEKVSLLSDNLMKCAYLQETYLYPAVEKQPPFICGMYSAPGPFVYRITVTGTNGVEIVSMPGNANYFVRFAPQVMDIQKTFATRKNYQPLDAVRKKFEIWLAANYSHETRGGAPVAVGSVPADWGPQLVRPDFMNEAMFKK